MTLGIKNFFFSKIPLSWASETSGRKKLFIWQNFVSYVQSCLYYLIDDTRNMIHDDTFFQSLPDLCFSSDEDEVTYHNEREDHYNGDLVFVEIKCPSLKAWVFRLFMTVYSALI